MHKVLEIYQQQQLKFEHDLGMVTLSQKHEIKVVIRESVPVETLVFDPAGRMLQNLCSSSKRTCRLSARTFESDIVSYGLQLCNYLMWLPAQRSDITSHDMIVTHWTGSHIIESRTKFHHCTGQL